MTSAHTEENLADAPSRRPSPTDCKLSGLPWLIVERDFGVVDGHTYDMMALDSNAMKNLQRQPLPAAISRVAGSEPLHARPFN